MSEAIWLAGTSRPQASKETPEDWLSGFLAEKRIKADWITSAHILIFRKVNQPLEWPIPLFPFTWDAAPDRAHYLLGAVCREIRAGEQDLVLMLEKDPKGWNASLLASPTFFGQRNRIPPVELLETRTFKRLEDARDPSALRKYLREHGMAFVAGSLGETLPNDPVGWLQIREPNAPAWSAAHGTLRALNAAARSVSDHTGQISAILSREASHPVQISLLEGL
jgi:hypothetical protein